MENLKIGDKLKYKGSDQTREVLEVLTNLIYLSKIETEVEGVGGWFERKEVIEYFELSN